MIYYSSRLMGLSQRRKPGDGFCKAHTRMDGKGSGRPTS
jgi:hypothetical protein